MSEMEIRDYMLLLAAVLIYPHLHPTEESYRAIAAVNIADDMLENIEQHYHKNPE